MIEIPSSEVQVQVLQGAISAYVADNVSEETIQSVIAHMYRRGFVIASYRVPGPPDPPLVVNVTPRPPDPPYVSNRPKGWA